MNSLTTTAGQILKFRAAHNDRYDYSATVYINAKTRIMAVCLSHGEFWQLPCNHLRGNGCPKCSHEKRWANTLKQRCKDLGINYWRALKRREAGMSDDQIVSKSCLRSERKSICALTIYGKKYPNIEAACRALKPCATATTIGRWLRAGTTPDDAFERTPNPGFSAGIIYLVCHIASGYIYIGLTIQILARRWEDHLGQARAGHIKGANSLHAAIREYGPNAFTITQIDQGTTKLDLEKKERYWINALGTVAPNGYNISKGGASGGSNRRPITVEGQKFASVGDAVEYIAQSRGISLHAAKARLLVGRIDVRTPAKKGESLVRTPAYKVWSRIFHGLLSRNSKHFDPEILVLERWRSFQSFYEDVGQPAVPGMTFTRIDKSKGFFPANCDWMSRSESSRLGAAQQRTKRSK